MTRRALTVLILCLAAAAGAAAQGGAPKVLSVSDLRGLVQAIGSDRTVVLRKGDYRLSKAVGIKNPNVEWIEVDGSKELKLKGLRNFTLRGADGARLVSDSEKAGILCVADSEGVTLDNLRFVREPPKGGNAELGEGEEAEEFYADSLYAESVKGLVVDRCSFEGPSDAAISLWECPGARISRATVRGVVGSVLAALHSEGLELSASAVSDCQGYPLFYFEDCDNVLVSGTRVESCEGDNFIEIYHESGAVAAIGFSDCSFESNEFDYFSGTLLLPSTEGCAFADNSFDENWAEDSVAYYGEDEYYYGDEGAEGEAESAYYAHYDSGLGFFYPTAWELQEAEDSGQVGIVDPSGEAIVLYMTAYKVPAQVDAKRQAAKVFADAATALSSYLGEELGIELSIGPSGEPSDESGLLAAEYAGEARSEEERADVRVRFILSRGSVRALVGMAKQASLLEPGGDVDFMLMSAEPLE